PHARAQPVHQTQVVGETAEQRLAQMDVRLDEAGQNVAAARVDHAVVTHVDVRGDLGDATVADRHVAVDDVPAIVHRDDDAATNEQRRHDDLRLATSDS